MTQEEYLQQQEQQDRTARKFAHTPVRSEPMKQARRAVDGMRVALVCCGLFAIGLGVLLWIVGAAYTLRGWPLGLNLVVGAVGLPFRVGVITGWALVFALPLGLAYSLVEVKLRPQKARYRAFYARYGWQGALAILLIFGFIIATDLGTTYLSTITPVADAYSFTRNVAANPYLSGGWAIFLTFAPEWLILIGLLLIRRS